jgi:transposase
LAPTLKVGQVVVLDGLGAHRTNRVRALIEERGAELLFLASYSPELNPIEQAFSKIKNIVRKAGAHYPRGARRSHRRGALGGYA